MVYNNVNGNSSPYRCKDGLILGSSCVKKSRNFPGKHMRWITSFHKYVRYLIKQFIFIRTPKSKTKNQNPFNQRLLNDSSAQVWLNYLWPLCDSFAAWHFFTLLKPSFKLLLMEWCCFSAFTVIFLFYLIRIDLVQVVLPHLLLGVW